MSDHTTPAVPPPVANFLTQDPGAVVLGPDTAPGRVPQVAVHARDVASLRDLPCPQGLASRVIGLFLDEGATAPALVARPEWPTLRSFRSRRARDGWWTVLRFAAAVDVEAVLGELAAQSTWGVRRPAATDRPEATAPDVRVINPIGFRVDAEERVLDLSVLDLSGIGLSGIGLRGAVTPAVVRGLRDALGVRVDRWDDTTDRTVESLCLAGVPVVVDPAVDVPSSASVPARLLGEADLADPLAREERSLEQRRAAYDAVAVRAGTIQPSVSILLATKRADMLDFALAQVARQRDVASLELVLAPHGFDVDPVRVRDAVGEQVSVAVVPQAADTLFGDVLEAASRAAGGDVVLKMDDDDWYAPDVVSDLLRARGYSGAEMVGMPAELHYLTEQDLTVKRGHPTELYARFVAGGTMLVDRHALRAVGGFRSVRKFVDAQLIDSILAAGGAVYRTHGLGYVLRRNPSGHTWQVDLDYLLDPRRTVATWPGFHPSRLLEADVDHVPRPGGARNR
ncbi:MAG: hypothetical protein KKA97_02675 [Actinobacteria bacterium]|nr:hypothetical protein [Actinomycetota bacterium]